MTKFHPCLILKMHGARALSKNFSADNKMAGMGMLQIELRQVREGVMGMHGNSRCINKWLLFS